MWVCVLSQCETYSAFMDTVAGCKRQKQKLERQEHTAEEKQKHRKEWKKRKRKAKRARAKTCSTADKEHITPKTTMKLLPFQPKR